MLLPQARCELRDIGRRVPVDALQDVDEIVVGIDIVKTAGRDQTLDDADMPGAELCPAEHPVFSTLGNRTERPFEMVGVDRDIGIGEEDLKRHASVAGVGQRLRERVAR